MEEGFRMIGSLHSIDPYDIAIGAPVRVAYSDVTPEWTLLQFTPH